MKTAKLADLTTSKIKLPRRLGSLIKLSSIAHCFSAKACFLFYLSFCLEFCWNLFWRSMLSFMLRDRFLQMMSSHKGITKFSRFGILKSTQPLSLFSMLWLFLYFFLQPYFGVFLRLSTSFLEDAGLLENNYANSELIFARCGRPLKSYRFCRVASCRQT